VYFPVLAYQSIRWIPYLALRTTSHERVMDGVLKAAGLLVTVLIMAVMMALPAVWAEKGRGNTT